jgi:hypothetical protein
MTLVFKLLPHSNFTSVETLPIMTVDWLGGGRPGGSGERGEGKEGERGSGERGGEGGKKRENYK